MIEDREHLSSHLKIEFETLEMILDKEDLPKTIYKDFFNMFHLEEFINGIMTFSGLSKNRFTLKNEHRRDIFEYRNVFSSHIFAYALSFSTEPLHNGRPMLKIKNIKDLIHGIINDLEKSKETYCHEVIWLSINDLLRYIDKVPSIANIREYPRHHGEEIILFANNISGRLLKYENKITDLKLPYDSISVAQNAFNKDIRKNEKEWRLTFNSGDFQGKYSGNSLLHLVKHLKLNCPSVGKYCEVV